MTDVDNFHLINDYWGYEMGTNILNFILKKLELFPQTLFVNRYHSDIFVGIIDITGQDPAVVREKISAYHKQAIRFFHDRNIRISMDDFGSGYSSLNSLKDILFDEVKIDKHFLSAGLSEKGKIVLEEMFHLLKRTDKWIVCEGVETKEMVDFLIAEGCDELQGFYYYKPMEQKNFEELIA